jgi:hypothetical protein
MSPALIPACCKPLADGLDELNICGDSAASQRIHLQADRLAGTNQFSPRINGMVAVKESLHGAIHERQHPL